MLRGEKWIAVKLFALLEVLIEYCLISRSFMVIIICVAYDFNIRTVSRCLRKTCINTYAAYYIIEETSTDADNSSSKNINDNSNDTNYNMRIKYYWNTSKFFDILIDTLISPQV